MKKRWFKMGAVALAIFLIQGCKAIDSMATPSIPQNVKTAAMEKVDAEKELYGLGGATISDSGLEFAEAKAVINAKDNLKNSIETEANASFNSFMLQMDPYMKKIYTPIIPDLVNHTVEIEIGKAVEKGAWDDGKKAYSLVTVERASVFEESKNTFKIFTEKLSERIKHAKDSAENAQMPEKQNTETAAPKTEGTPNLELQKNSENYENQDRAEK